MNIKSDQASGPCEYCSAKPATVGQLCRGATGRVCEVMWACEDCAPDAKPAQEVRDNIEHYFGPGAYPDF